MSKKNHRQHRFSNINLESILSLLLVLGSILGTTIPLYINSSNQILAIREEIKANHNEIQSEMRDFHGRLERLDAEFKAHLMNQHFK